MIAAVIHGKGHLPRAVQPSSHLVYIQKVPVSPLTSKGTLDNRTHRLSPSNKTNFAVSLQICLTNCFHLALNLPPKPVPTPELIPFPPPRKSHKTQHIQRRQHPVRASQINHGVARIPHLPSAAKPRCCRKGLASAG